MRFVLALAAAGIVGVSGVAAVAQAPASVAASTPLEMEIQETQGLITRYQANERSMESALVATKALIETNQGTLARLEAQRPKAAPQMMKLPSSPSGRMPNLAPAKH